MAEKINDWIAVQLNAPKDVTLADLYVSGITAENTELKDMDYYRNIPQVQRMFTKDDKFDEVGFRGFYESSLRTFESFSDEEFLDNYIQSFERSPNDWINMTAPVMNTSVYLMPMSDKNRTTAGLGNIWEIGSPTFSDREVAQEQLVRDENGKLLDWTPNDKGGLKALFTPTIALAIYEEDSIDEMGVEHKKGDLKLDWKGDPYYEILGDRDGYNRDIAKFSDTLTKDGSFWNKLDVFDSDGIEKSIGATTMEMLLKAAPFFIPHVGPVIGAISAAKGFAFAMPTLIKSINDAFGGKEDPKFMGKSMTEWENLAQKFSHSTSDKGRRGFWNYENMSNIIVTSFSQFTSQRAVAQLGRVMSSNKMRQTATGRELARLYMALTSTTDAYQVFKRAGASDKTAGVGMLATFASMYGLLRLNYFNQWMFKDTFLDEYQDVNRTLREYLKQQNEHLYGSIMKEAEQKAAHGALMQKMLAKAWFKKVYDTTKSAWDAIPHGQIMNKGGQGAAQFFSDTANSALNEGIEETMEELSADIIKSIALGCEALGWNVTEDPTANLKFDLSPEEILARYSAAFVGGAIGGAMFNLYGYAHNEIDPVRLSNDVLAKLIYYDRNGYREHINKKLKQYHEKGLIPGNKNLSASKFGVITESNGNLTRKYLSAEGDDNQEQALYNVVSDRLTHFQNIVDNYVEQRPDFLIQMAALAAERAEVEKNDSSKKGQFFDPFIETMRARGLLDGPVQEYDDLTKRMTAVIHQIQSVEKSLGENNTGDPVGLKELKEHLKELQKEQEAILSGQNADRYLSDALHQLNPSSISFYLNDMYGKRDAEKIYESSVQRYAELRYNIDYSKASDELKKVLDVEFQLYTADRDNTTASLFRDIHYGLSSRLAKDIMAETAAYQGYTSHVTLDKFGQTYEEIRQRHKQIAELRAKPNRTSEEEASLALLQNQAQKDKDKYKAELEKLNKSLNNPYSQKLLEELDDFNTLYDLTDAIDIFSSNEATEQYKQSVFEFYKKLASEKKFSSELFLPFNHLASIYLDRVIGYLNDESLKILSKNAGVYFAFMQNTGDSDSDHVSKIANFTSYLNSTEFASKINTFLKNVYKNPINVDSEFKKLQEDLLKLKSDPRFAVFRNQRDSKGNIISRTVDFSAVPDNILDIIPKIITDYIQDLSNFAVDVKTIHPTDVGKDGLKRLLQNLNILVNDKKLNIIDRFEAEMERFNTMRNSIEDFNLDSQSLEELKTARGLLSIMRALVQSAGDGTNQQINKHRDKLKKDLFAELDKASREELEYQIDKMSVSIDAIIYQAEKNTMALPEVQKQIAYNVAPKLMSALYDHDDEDVKVVAKAIKKVFKKDVVKEFFESKEFTDKYSGFAWEVIDDQESYTKFIEMRREFYAYLKKEAESLPDYNNIGTQLAETIQEVLGDNPFDFSSTQFARRKEGSEMIVKPLDAAFYFMSIVGSDLNEFERKIYERYTKLKDTDRYLPFFSQEYAAQLLWSAVHNNSIFNSFINAIKIKSDDESAVKYLDNLSKLVNFGMVDGVSGAGKSTATAALVAGILKSEGYQIVALSSIEDRYKNLAGIISADAHGSTVSVLDNMIIDTKTDKPIAWENAQPSYNNETNHYEVESIFKPANRTINAKPSLAADADKVIYMIDEVTLQREDQLYALSAYAELLTKQGKPTFVIGLGDTMQNGFTELNDHKQRAPRNVNDCIFLRTPKLSTSLRAANRGKRDNLEQFEQIIQQLNDIYDRDRGLATSELNSKVKDLVAKGIKFINYETTDALYGEKFVADPVKLVDSLLAKKGVKESESRIVIIVDASTKNKYNAWSGRADKRVTILESSEVQGGEYDYAIVDKSFDTSYDSLKDFYTCISRSKMGTIIGFGKSDPRNIFNITVEDDNQDASFTILDPNSDAAKKQNNDYRQWRMAVFGNINAKTAKSSPEAKAETTPETKNDTVPGSNSEGNGEVNTGGTQTVVEEVKTENDADDVNESDESLLNEFANSEIEWAKNYREAKAAVASLESGNSGILWSDQDFYQYLDENNIILKASERVTGQDAITICKLVSDVVLNREIVEGKMNISQEWRNQLSETSATTVIEKIIANINNEHNAFYVTKEGNWNVLYYCIKYHNNTTNKNDFISIPVGVTKKFTNNFNRRFTVPHVNKINTYIPITSFGKKSIRIKDLLDKVRMIYPGGMGMYVGAKSELHGFGINKGKLFIPLIHPKKAYPKFLESFFTADVGAVEGKKPWLTQGYHKQPSLRTNEICVQRRLSFREYYKLLQYVHHVTVNPVITENASSRKVSQDQINAEKKYLETYFGLDNNFKFPQFSDSIAEPIRKEQNWSEAIEKYRKIEIASSRTRGNLIAQLITFFSKRMNIDGNTFFTNLHKASLAPGLGFSFTFGRMENPVHVIVDKKTDDNITFICYQYDATQGKIVKTGEISRKPISIDNVILDYNNIAYEAFKPIYNGIYGKELNSDEYSIEKGNLSVNLVRSYISDNELKINSHIEPIYMYGLFNGIDVNETLLKTIDEFLEQGHLSKGIFANVYKKGTGSAKEATWKVETSKPHEADQSDIIDIYMPNYSFPAKLEIITTDDKEFDEFFRRMHPIEYDNDFRVSDDANLNQSGPTYSFRGDLIISGEKFGVDGEIRIHSVVHDGDNWKVYAMPKVGDGRGDEITVTEAFKEEFEKLESRMHHENDTVAVLGSATMKNDDGYDTAAEIIMRGESVLIKKGTKEEAVREVIHNGDKAFIYDINDMLYVMEDASKLEEKGVKSDRILRGYYSNPDGSRIPIVLENNVDHLMIKPNDLHAENLSNDTNAVFFDATAPKKQTETNDNKQPEQKQPISFEKQINDIKRYLDGFGLNLANLVFTLDSGNIKFVVYELNGECEKIKYKIGVWLEFEIDEDGKIGLIEHRDELYKMTQSIVNRNSSLDITKAQILPSRDSKITKISLTLRDGSRKVFALEKINSKEWLPEDITDKPELFIDYIKEVEKASADPNIGFTPELAADVIASLKAGTLSKDLQSLIIKHKLTVQSPATRFIVKLVTQMRSTSPNNACNIG